MIINRNIIEAGITPAVLARVIERHEAEMPRLRRLFDYYTGRQAILNRTKKTKNAANNKIVCNNAKYITDIATGYFIGTPVKYSAADGADISPLVSVYATNEMASADMRLAKDMSVFGRAFELIYANGDAMPKSTVISPMDAFVMYSADCEREPLAGVYYYREYDINGVCTGVRCYVYDKTRIYEYYGQGGSIENTELVNEQIHRFGDVPLIEYPNNDERTGDFEAVLPLLDAYNTVISDRVNDKEQFVDSFLFISNMDMDSDTAASLKEEKILLGMENSDAKYLSSAMTEADVKILRDDIKEDIHRLSMVPDLSDEEFSGNVSGVAIRYKLIGFEQMIKNKERLFREALKKRFAAYASFLATRSVMAAVPVTDVTFTFTRNLPENELEKAQMISYLRDLLSSETLIEQLGFVDDAAEEADLARREQAEQYRTKVESVEQIARGGGF